MKCPAFVLLIAAFGLIAGCAASAEEGLKTETVEFAESTPLFDGSPYKFTMEMTVEWPVGGIEADALKAMQKGITGLLFGSDLETTDLEYAMKEYYRRSVGFYRDENREYAEDVDQEWGFMLDWSETAEGSFLPEYDGMVSYIKYIYGYSGGAHGMDAKTCRTFDLSTGAEVPEKDIFKRGYEKRLTEALRENLPKSVEDKDMLFETEITPSDDFYITAEGITYIYQRYEVGPYALGIIEVTVPWEEIQDITR